MAALRKMLGSLQDPSTGKMMQLMETQSIRTLASEELADVLASLEACAVSGETDPVRLDWGC